MGRLTAIAILAITTQAAADPKPVTTTPVARSADLAALLARTDSVAKEVAKIRGLPLKHAIPNELVDKDELRARLVKMAADTKTAAQTTAEGLALARWGLIPLSTDYRQLLIDLLTEQIAGYYDPETKTLTISKSAGDDPGWAEMVLAHELDHGLQDQSYDLKKFEDLPDGEGDASAARHALVEGDGIALMIEVMLGRTHTPVPWSNPEVADMIVKAMSAPGNGDGLDKAPLAIRESMLFPYRAGFAFVAALRRRQPWSAVDAAFARPPRSTEQILHPERYAADDPPIPIEATVPAALPGFAIAHSTVWGELGFDIFLRSHHVDTSVAAVAAAGWGGDRAIVLTRAGDALPEHAVGILRMEWDSEADAIEATEAGARALDDAVVGGTAERSQTHTRWLGLDGRVSWIERRGPALVIVLGAPAWSAEALASEVWTATHVKRH
jgi:hypothetical protein